MDGSSIEIYYMINIPGGDRWYWQDTDLLVIEATLDDGGRRHAIDQAFADAHDRALQAAPAA